MTEEELEQLRRTMVRQSCLFDDPHAYRCGVEDALASIRAALVRPGRSTTWAAPAPRR